MQRFGPAALTALRTTVHVAGYAIGWAAVVAMVTGFVISAGAGLACRMDRSIALCAYVDDAFGGGREISEGEFQ